MIYFDPAASCERLAMERGMSYAERVALTRNRQEFCLTSAGTGVAARSRSVYACNMTLGGVAEPEPEPTSAIPGRNEVCRRWRQRVFWAVLLLLLPVGASAKDWPQWRGPNRDSVWNETGILQTFPAGGLQVRWRAAVGAGHSSPVVARGRVYATGSEGQKPKTWERVQCFDERTGKRRWTFADEVIYRDSYNPANPSGPCGTSIVEGGRFFNLGSTGHLVCLEARTGTVIWKRVLAEDYGLEQFPDLTSCPLVDGGLLIVVIGGKPGARVVAFDKRTGKEVWRALDEPRTFGSPIVISAGGKRQLIVWTPKSVAALDPRTGRVWWREKLDTPEQYVVATPVYHDGLLLVSGLMLRLDPGAADPRVLWPETKAPLPRIMSHTCIPLILGEHVFGGKLSGRLVCLEARTGRQVWETDKVTGLKNGATMHLTANGDSVLLFTDQGNLIRARLSAAGYQELSRVKLVESTFLFGDRKIVWSVPAFADQQVFARNDKELICASLAAKL